MEEGSRFCEVRGGRQILAGRLAEKVKPRGHLLFLRWWSRIISNMSSVVKDEEAGTTGTAVEAHINIIYIILIS